MASFISTNETLERRLNGVVSRTGGKIINRVLEESAGVDAGRFVCPSGTTGIACEDIDSAADAKIALGPLVYRPMSYDADLTDGAPHYAENEVACILEEGYMFVACEGTAVAEKPVLVRHTSDGGSNTELGKVSAISDYPSGGIVCTPVAATASTGNHYSLTLTDGVVTETYSFNSDASPTAQEIVEGLAAAINAGTAFDATEDNSALSVTSVSGVLEIRQTSQFTFTNPARCSIVPNAYFAESRTGAGLVEIRVGAPNR